MAPLGQERAIRRRVASSGLGPVASTVAIWSASKTKNPGAEATHFPALTHSFWSTTTSYPDAEPITDTL